MWILSGMDCRTETHLREKQARRSYASLPERAGDLQQQVRGQLQNKTPSISFKRCFFIYLF